MKKIDLDRHFKGLALQDYFSLGYLFLILLGLINNIIYYERLGINIFDYTSISDILLTPLNTLFSNYKLTLIIFTLFIVCFFLCKYLLKFIQDYARKRAEIRNKEFHEMPFQPISISIYLFVSLFFGLNLGASSKIKSIIENNEFKINRVITMIDNTQKEVYVVGQNSTYLFYVEKNSKDIQIMPISGNVKTLRKIAR